jgi:FG-GAP-like repeat
VAYDEFETKSIVNSPSGPGGFGTPSTSDAFSTAHIYDSLLFKSGGKPAPGKGPTAVATGDLNGDGFADMVVANFKSKNISVLINLGDGTFLDPVNISTGKGGPQDVVLGDFDGDTNLDAVISQPATGGISFLKGNGAGGFAAPVVTATPKFKPFALATGDIDGDTDLDLVATSRGTNSVGVFLGNGAGALAFGAPIKLLGKNPSDVALGDFNNDGDLDVVTANAASNNISFLPGNGTGTLGAEVRFAAGLRSSSLAVADLDNDGNLDVAVSNEVSRFVTVLLGNGAVPAATQFAPQLHVAVPGLHQSTSIVTGDFDGDGVIDLGLGNRVGNKFTVLRGLGAGAYSQPYEFDLGKDPIGGFTGGTAIADFNNDGLLDIVATSLARNDIRVLLHKL